MFEWIDKYRIVRRIVLLWCLTLVTYVVLESVKHFERLNEADATVILAVLGLVATAIGFYSHQRFKEDNA